jgi:glycosyltransferase involved in cell wall biosynthesis
MHIATLGQDPAFAGENSRQMFFKLPLSCFIIAKNEADRIERTIRSVQPWVDEVVVVVDSSSSDNTVAVAQAAHARVISQPWRGFGGQKRFAEEQCHHEWVLNLDADEVVPPELQDRITELFRSGVPEHAAYGMPIHTIYPGQTKPRIWARDHWCVRLYNRKVVRFRDSSIHDTVVTDGHVVGRICAPIHHYSIRSFDHMKAKLDKRMALSAEHASANSTIFTLGRLAIEFPMNFYKYYIVRRHITGGLIGFRYAATHAWFRTIKVYRLWCQQRTPHTQKRASIDEDEITANFTESNKGLNSNSETNFCGIMV